MSTTEATCPGTIVGQNVLFQCLTSGLNGTIPYVSFSYQIVRPPLTNRIEISFGLANTPPNLQTITINLSTRGSEIVTENPEFARRYSTQVIFVENQITVILTDTIESIEYTFVFEATQLDLARATATASLMKSPLTSEPVDPDVGPDYIILPGSGSPFTSGSISVKFGSFCYTKYHPMCVVPGFTPTIVVDAVSAAKNQNFGEAFYTVDDIQPYSGSYNCKVTILEKDGRLVYRTEFSTFPEINPVVKGKGCSLLQKFTSLIEKYNLGMTIDQFTGSMALYALSKYILGRLLFGKFSLKYLTRSFNVTFLETLQNSRFQQFKQLYTNPSFGLIGFERFFKRSIKC
ncbi:Hypothetical protein POVR1_LOCUS310 [uncultured virus]|nr:Hypothetical protein POVR1_LOCUS310 [uncultured virus]